MPASGGLPPFPASARCGRAGPGRGPLRSVRRWPQHVFLPDDRSMSPAPDGASQGTAQTERPRHPVLRRVDSKIQFRRRNTAADQDSEDQQGETQHGWRRRSQHGHAPNVATIYGLTLSVVAIANWPWPLFMGAAFILFAVLHGVRYRQVSCVSADKRHAKDHRKSGPGHRQGLTSARSRWVQVSQPCIDERSLLSTKEGRSQVQGPDRLN